jgi:hypothetical protein
MLAPGGQLTAVEQKAGALGRETVDSTAARLREEWMPDTAEKYNLLLDCITHPPTAATARPECIPALKFVSNHCRYYTPTPGGQTSIICEPLRSGEPWLDIATWMERNWDRMTPGYNAAALPNSQSLSVPGTGTGASPPANSQAIVLPNPSATTTLADCSARLNHFLSQNPQYAMPAPYNISSSGQAAFLAANPDCQIDPFMPWNMEQPATVAPTHRLDQMPTQSLPPVPLMAPTAAEAEAAATRRNMFIGATVAAVAIVGGGIYAYRRYSKKTSRKSRSGK